MLPYREGRWVLAVEPCARTGRPNGIGLVVTLENIPRPKPIFCWFACQELFIASTQ